MHLCAARTRLFVVNTTQERWRPSLLFAASLIVSESAKKTVFGKTR
jgi:hypothetical protein